MAYRMLASDDAYVRCMAYHTGRAATPPCKIYAACVCMTQYTAHGISSYLILQGGKRREQLAALGPSHQPHRE